MKTAESRTASNVIMRKSNPFFSKESNGHFFGSQERTSHTSTPNLSSSVQAKLNVGSPNDSYEKEADSMADTVVQRLAEPSPIQTKPQTPGTFTPFVQKKCDSCEQDEKLQKKEEDESPGADKKLQRKPIFESNAQPPDDETNIQRKCAACEKEEKLQKKPQDRHIQQKPIFESRAESAKDEITVRRKCAACGKEENIQQKLRSPLNIQHKCSECEKEEHVQKKEKPDKTNVPDIESRLDNSRGGGHALPEKTRQQMESSIGADFSNVRIHDDSTAARLSGDLNAQAFTHGHDIYFNAGKYDTGSRDGQHLLAHELTHTVQQGAASHAQNKYPYLKSIHAKFLQLQEETTNLQAKHAEQNFQNSGINIQKLEMPSLASLSGIAKYFNIELPANPIDAIEKVLDILQKPYVRPFLSVLPGFDTAILSLQLALKTYRFIEYIINNKEKIINEIKQYIETKLDQTEPVLKEKLKAAFGFVDHRHFVAVWEAHLLPMLVHLKDNWWETIKDTLWEQIWPFEGLTSISAANPADRKGLGKDLADIGDHFMQGFKELKSMNFSKFVDQCLLLEKGLAGLVNRFYGWAAIVIIASETLAGAGIAGVFSGGTLSGPGAAAGFGAGLATAGEIGEALLIATVAIDAAILIKSILSLNDFDSMLVVEEKLIENNEYYKQIAQTSLSLTLTGLMFLLAYLGGKIAEALLGKLIKFLPKSLQEVLQNIKKGMRGEKPGASKDEPLQVEKNPPELDPEFAQLREAVKSPENIREVTDPDLVKDYDFEVKAKGHTYRRSRVSGGWCRYSEPICGFKLDDINAVVNKAKGINGPTEPVAGDVLTVPYKGGQGRAEIISIDDKLVKIKIRSKSASGDITQTMPREEFDRLLQQKEIIRWTDEREKLMKSRPNYEEGLVDKVWDSAKQADGKVYDPHTKEELNWDKSKGRFDQWHMGHKPGKEYAKLVDDYVNGKYTYEEFLKEYNNPDNYWPESPEENLSHKHEVKPVQKKLLEDGPELQLAPAGKPETLDQPSLEEVYFSKNGNFYNVIPKTAVSVKELAKYLFRAANLENAEEDKESPLNHIIKGIKELNGLTFDTIYGKQSVFLGDIPFRFGFSDKALYLFSKTPSFTPGADPELELQKMGVSSQNEYIVRRSILDSILPSDIYILIININNVLSPGLFDNLENVERFVADQLKKWAHEPLTKLPVIYPNGGEYLDKVFMGLNNHSVEVSSFTDEVSSSYNLIFNRFRYYKDEIQSLRDTYCSVFKNDKPIKELSVWNDAVKPALISIPGAITEEVACAIKSIPLDMAKDLGNKFDKVAQNYMDATLSDRKEANQQTLEIACTAGGIVGDLGLSVAKIKTVIDKLQKADELYKTYKEVDEILTNLPDLISELKNGDDFLDILFGIRDTDSKLEKLDTWVSMAEKQEEPKPADTGNGLAQFRNVISKIIAFIKKVIKPVFEIRKKFLQFISRAEEALLSNPVFVKFLMALKTGKDIKELLKGDIPERIIGKLVSLLTGVRDMVAGVIGGIGDKINETLTGFRDQLIHAASSFAISEIQSASGMVKAVTSIPYLKEKINGLISDKLIKPLLKKIGIDTIIEKINSVIGMITGNVLTAVDYVVHNIADFLRKSFKDFHLQLQPKNESSGSTENTNSSVVIRGMNESKGVELPEKTRGEMESAFGRTFQSVRIHEDAPAQHASEQLQANAFTNKNNIFFNSGQYKPDTNSGRKLLAHELTHVVQQNEVNDNEKLQASFKDMPGRVINKIVSDVWSNSGKTAKTGDNENFNVLDQKKMEKDLTELRDRKLKPGDVLTLPIKNMSRAVFMEMDSQFVRLIIKSKSASSDIVNLMPVTKFNDLLKQHKIIRWTEERQYLMRNRPPHMPGLVKTVWEIALAEAKKKGDGKVRDPHDKKKILTWEEDKDRTNQWHMGHRPGKEYVKLVDKFVSGGITFDQFIAEYNDKDNYWPEDPGENLSHRHEEK